MRSIGVSFVGVGGELRDGVETFLQLARRSQDKPKERRGRLEGTSEVLGMILYTDVVGMALQLQNLHPLAGVVAPHELHAVALQLSDILGVDFVTVTMALKGNGLAQIQLTDGAGFGSLLEQSGALTKTHGAPHVGPGDLRHKNDERRGGRFVELGRLGVGDSNHVTGKLNSSNLKSKANSQEGDLVFTGPLGSGNLSLDSSGAEAAGHQNTVGRADGLPGVMEFDGIDGLHFGFEISSFNPLEV